MDRTRWRQTKVVSELKRLLAESGPHSLLWYHRLGQLVLQYRPEERKEYGKYLELLQELVDGFQSTGDSRDTKLQTLRSLLDKSCAIAAAYEPAQLKIFERPAAGQFPLRWSHLRLIATMNRSDRRYFEEGVIARGLSVADLRLEIRLRHGRKKHGGRKHRQRAADQALQQLVQDCEAWVRKMTSHWLSQESSTLTAEDIHDLRANSEPKLARAVMMLQELRATALAVSRRLIAKKNGHGRQARPRSATTMLRQHAPSGSPRPSPT